MNVDNFFDPQTVFALWVGFVLHRIQIQVSLSKLKFLEEKKFSVFHQKNDFRVLIECHK